MIKRLRKQSLFIIRWIFFFNGKNEKHNTSNYSLREYSKIQISWAFWSLFLFISVLRKLMISSDTIITFECCHDTKWHSCWKAFPHFIHHCLKPGTLQILINLYNYGQTSFHCFYIRQSGFSIRRKWSLGKGVWCREKQVTKSTFFPGYAPGSEQLQHIQFHSYVPFI